MIAHLVLLKPRASLTAEERQAILQTVIESVRRCPSVRACRIGRRVRHGLPGYERAMSEDYQVALILEFDTLEGLTEYLRHAEHEKLGGLYSSASAAALAYDYEFAPLEELQHTI